MKNLRLINIFSIIGLLLLIPLIAMQFTNEVNWTVSDFLMMGLLLCGTGLLFELILSKARFVQNKIILCAVILTVLFLVWAELAVGIFVSPFAGS